MIDANTVVSAALNPSGIPRLAIAAARRHGSIALSPDVYDEIANVLSRPKFANALRADRRTEILELLTAGAVWFDPKETVRDCRDAKDNRYLELALAASATTIVTGDQDLLILHPWRGVAIMKPAAFLSGAN